MDFPSINGQLHFARHLSVFVMQRPYGNFAYGKKRGAASTTSECAAVTPMDGELNNLDTAIARVSMECSRTEIVLQKLTGKLMEAQNDERQPIILELNNEMNQELAMLAVDLGLLLRLLPKGDPCLIESILKLQQHAEALSANLA
jgi:hypothetical protein